MDVWSKVKRDKFPYPYPATTCSLKKVKHLRVEMYYNQKLIVNTEYNYEA